MNTNTLRTEYAAIMKRTHADNRAVFKAGVLAALATVGISPDNATPQQWIKAAKAAEFTCKRCMGTGKYQGLDRNGRPKGGDCFRCQGTGRRNDADQKRNFGYDCYRMVEEA